MTSMAERKRRKRLARKIQQLEAFNPPVSAKLSCQAEASTQPENELPPPRRRGLITELQEAAMTWFAALRRKEDAGGEGAVAARPQLEKIRLELSPDEFAILSELCRSSGPVTHRVGRSRSSVIDIELSALRKLVIYRSANGIEE